MNGNAPGSQRVAAMQWFSVELHPWYFPCPSKLLRVRFDNVLIKITLFFKIVSTYDRFACVGAKTQS